MANGPATLRGVGPWVAGSILRSRCNYILLYHSTYAVPPASLDSNLHNAPPPVLRAQLSWLRRHFQIVTVDELFDQLHCRTGMAAVTFDDAYESVFDEALPVLEELEIPAAIFLNSVSLQGRPFWRDKIRYVLTRGRMCDFLQRNPDLVQRHGLTETTFYRASKSMRVPSTEIDTALDAYLTQIGADVRDMQHCIRDSSRLAAHPLLTFGNHGHSHFVLSSLTAEQQLAEIRQTHEILCQHAVRRTAIFSVPFGEDTDFNADTTRALRTLGYRGLLRSRGLANGRRRGEAYGMPTLERHMPVGTVDGFIMQMARVAVRSSLASVSVG